MRTTLLAIALATAIAPIAATADDDSDARDVRASLAFVSSSAFDSPPRQKFERDLKRLDQSTRLATLAIDCADEVKNDNDGQDAYAYPMGIAVGACQRNDWSGDTCTGLHVLWQASGGK
jgi:hypothetical protein